MSSETARTEGRVDTVRELTTTEACAGKNSWHKGRSHRLEVAHRAAEGAAAVATDAEPVGAAATVAATEGPVIEAVKDSAEQDVMEHTSFRGYRKMEQSFLRNRKRWSTLIPVSVLTLP